jgi:hypothetical protein
MEQSTEDRVLPHHNQTGLDRSHYFDVEEVEEGGPAEGVVGGKMLLVGELIVGVVVAEGRTVVVVVVVVEGPTMVACQVWQAELLQQGYRPSS